MLIDKCEVSMKKLDSSLGIRDCKNKLIFHLIGFWKVKQTLIKNSLTYTFHFCHECTNFDTHNQIFIFNSCILGFILFYSKLHASSNEVAR